MNSKVLLGFNIVLALAVVVLFFLYSKVKPSSTDATNSVATENAKGDDVSNSKDPKFKIAYFELDTLQNNYTYAIKMRKSLSAKQNQIESQLKDLKSSIMAKGQAYYKKGPTMTQQEQVDASNEMNKLQQDYGMKEQQLGQQFQEETRRKLVEMRTRIQNFLKGYAKSHGYAFVLATSEDDNIFYYKDSLRNVTNDIVNGLNKLETSDNSKN
jgi:outer membrane protein